MSTRILIAGIGNIFLGDDAFGSEVSRRLMKLPWPEGVQVADFGIRGFDLASALMENYDAFILIDAVPCGEAPGTLYTMEIDVDAIENDSEKPSFDAHSLDPLRVLQMVKSMGDRDVLLMRGHGTVVTGESVETATTQAIRFDNLARVMWELATSGLKARELSPEDTPSARSGGRDRSTGGWAALEGVELWGWNMYKKLLQVNNIGLPDDAG